MSNITMETLPSNNTVTDHMNTTMGSLNETSGIFSNMPLNETTTSSNILNSALTNTAILNSTTEDSVLNDVINSTLMSTLFDDMLNRTAKVHEPPMLTTNPAEAVIYTIIAVLTSGLGLVGNCFIIVVFSFYRKLKVGCWEFIVNLAISDILALVIANPMCIIGVLKGSEYLDTTDWLKDWVSSACMISCFSSLLNHTLIALTRYLMINHTREYKKHFQIRSLNIGCCIGVWVFSTLMVIGNFKSWGDLSLAKRIFSCMSDKIKGGVFYMVWIVMGMIAFCLTMTAFFYIKTIWYISQTKRKVFSMGMANEGRFSTPWIEIAKSAKSVFLVFVAFVLSWAPYAFVIFIDLGYPLSFSVHLWVTWFSHFHSAFNFIIYWFANTRFREGYKILTKNSVAPETTGTGFTGGENRNQIT